jgi:sulfur-oxidizing protein SoxX
VKLAVSMLAAAAAAGVLAQAMAAGALPAAGSGDTPLTREPGDAARGRTIVLDRNASACILCHAVPGAEVAGDLAPPLGGVGARLSVEELRARLVDSSVYNANTIMPAYYRTRELNRVAAAYRDKTILSAQQIEDVVAYLRTLR